MTGTIYGRFLDVAKKYPERPALMYKQNGEYTSFSYDDLLRAVDSVAAALQQLGIRKGHMVGILSYNRPEWVITDLAVLKLGGVIVPIYHNLTSSYARYVINDSGMECIFVENADLLAMIDSVRHKTPSLTRVVIFDDTDVHSKYSFIRFAELCDRQFCGAIDTDVLSDDLATIVYTSGTTGKPKGVMLTHKNIISNASVARERFDANQKDVFLSFLPLCHMFERTCGYYALLFSGAAIAYVENFTTITEDVLKVRPTLIIAVPRVLEKVYERVEKTMQVASAVRRSLVSSATKDLNKYISLKHMNRKIPVCLRVRCYLHKRIVATKFKRLCGGRVRLIISGGAPLDRHIARLLFVFGFNIVEGYGLTEASPVVCSNTVEDNCLGTAGKPFDGVEVKIGRSNEILVRGPNVMKGYFNKPDETAEAIDSSGWLHTGDQGRIDDNGNLIITGRIKEMIVTAYGENIAPVPIERRIAKSSYVEQVMLYGDQKKHVVALVVPNKESIEHYAQLKGVVAADYPTLLRCEDIRKLVASELNAVNKDLSSFERVTEFALLANMFTPENEMLTPTLKLRRGVIAEKYGSLIESLYSAEMPG